MSDDLWEYRIIGGPYDNTTQTRRETKPAPTLHFAGMPYENDFVGPSMFMQPDDRALDVHPVVRVDYQLMYMCQDNMRRIAIYLYVGARRLP